MFSRTWISAVERPAPLWPVHVRLAPPRQPVSQADEQGARARRRQRATHIAHAAVPGSIGASVPMGTSAVSPHESGRARTADAAAAVMVLTVAIVLPPAARCV